MCTVKCKYLWLLYRVQDWSEKYSISVEIVLVSSILFVYDIQGSNLVLGLFIVKFVLKIKECWYFDLNFTADHRHN